MKRYVVLKQDENGLRYLIGYSGMASLWPLELNEARYFFTMGEARTSRDAMRLRLPSSRITAVPLATAFQARFHALDVR